MGKKSTKAFLLRHFYLIIKKLIVEKKTLSCYFCLYSTTVQLRIIAIPAVQTNDTI